MSTEANIASRKAAELLFKTMIDCVRDDYRKLDQPLIKLKSPASI